MNVNEHRQGGNLAANHGIGSGGGSFHFQNSTVTPQLATSPIYANGKVVGQVEGDTFKKSIMGSKHLLRQPPAIAFSLASLHMAEANGATRIEVTDREAGIVYAATLRQIWDLGRDIERGGFERQRYLELRYWTTRNAGQQRIEQLDLFGGVL